jgi:hypothetical protein
MEILINGNYSGMTQTLVPHFTSTGINPQIQVEIISHNEVEGTLRTVTVSGDGQLDCFDNVDGQGEIGLPSNPTIKTNQTRHEE